MDVKMIRKSSRWTALEERVLYLAARKLHDEFYNHRGAVSPTSSVVLSLVSELKAKRDSARDVYAILKRLSEMGFLEIACDPKDVPSDNARYLFNIDSGILSHNLRTPTYIKYFKPSLDTFPELKNDFLSQAKAFLATFSPEESTLCSKAVKELADSLVHQVNIYLEEAKGRDKSRLTKIQKYATDLSATFFLLDNGIEIKGTKGLEVVKAGSFHDYVSKKQDKIVQNKLNDMRTEISHGHYTIPIKTPLKPSFIACSVGTGIGKSFGSLDVYVNRIVNLYPNPITVDDIGIGGYTNNIFITPQKAQIDCDPVLLDTLSQQGVQLLSVLAKADISSLVFVDWLTGEKNSDKYKRWFIGSTLEGSAPFDKTPAKVAYRDLEASITNFERAVADSEPQEDIDRAKRRVKLSEAKFRDKLEAQCIEELGESLTPEDLVKQGYGALLAKATGESGKPIGKLPISEKRKIARFELLKLSFPFEVAKSIPCFMAMTTAKSMRSARTLKRKKNGGYNATSIPIDALVGSKEYGNPVYVKDKETGHKVPLLISPVLNLKQSEKDEFLKDSYFKPREGCQYREKRINFSIVIDELHVAYDSMLKNTIKNLINEDVHTLHIYTWASDLIKHAEDCHEAGHTLENIDGSRDSWERIKECLKFERDLDDYLVNKCNFTKHVDGRQLLHSFNRLRGNFEVDGADAESITRITRNVFSFNARLFANENDLKRIRAQKDIAVSTYRLYFEKEGDTEDTNPTLFDLYQLMLAIVGASAKIKDSKFINWLKTSDHIAFGKMNEFTTFISQVRSISADIQYMLDQPVSADDVKIDHLYAHFQPKIVFSLSPIDRFDTALEDSRRNIINLSFNMDLVKASPEVSFLKMLAYTSNQLLPLSATSGYHNLYNGNYSVKFMKKMCRLLDIDFRVRDELALELVETLTEARRALRDVGFNEFPENSLYPTERGSEERIRISRELADRVFVYWDKQGNRIRKDSSIYKKRELYRQLDMLLHCYEKRENALVFSISHDFMVCLSEAVRREPRAMKDNYGIEVLYSIDEKPKVISLDPFKDGHSVNLILYDASLVKALDSDPDVSLDDFTTIKDFNQNVVLCSSFKSGGTGLNNVVTYLASNEDGELLEVKEDYQNILVAGSPYYTEVNGGGTLDTLANYQIAFKHIADNPKLAMKMSDIYPSLSYGDGRKIIDNEHLSSIEKENIQTLGRGERRDTHITTRIYVPSDVVEASSFFFSKLKAKRNPNGMFNKDYNQYRSMSVITKDYADFSVLASERKSFENEEVRAKYEDEMYGMSIAVDDAHDSDIKSSIRSFQKTGDDAQLDFCEEIRSELAFTDPAKWMESVRGKAEKAGANAVARTSKDMFFDSTYLPEGVALAYASSESFFKLTDLVHGVRRYSPWDSIFPNDTFLDKGKVEAENVVSKALMKIEMLKRAAMKTGHVPIPAIVPLLRGNVGELVVVEVLMLLNRMPMTAAEAKEKLSPKVYERFDYFIEVGEDLVCVDAKWWSKESLDVTRVEKINRHIDLKKGGVISAVEGKYGKISFVYLNAYHGDTMFKENQTKDGEVSYLSLFTLSNYMLERERQVNPKQDNSRWMKYQTREKEVRVNPKLIALLGL